jgi:hypothetical protein
MRKIKSKVIRVPIHLYARVMRMIENDRQRRKRKEIRKYAVYKK